LRYDWWDVATDYSNLQDTNSVDPTDYAAQDFAAPSDLNDDSYNGERYVNNCDDYMPRCYFPYYRYCYWVRRCYCRHRWIDY
jgi:hypothetical protein